MSHSEHYQILIIGGGTGGISVASHLFKEIEDPQIAILEPAEYHYYQPGWTFVGGGIFKKEETARPMADIIPDKVDWIRDAAATIDPDKNIVTTAAGQTIAYDYLVVAAGIQIDWDAIPGLREGLGKNGIVSNYDYETAPITWETIKNFKGGTALFTQPKPPFKCPGAAQKILYLADDAMRKRNVRKKSELIFCSAAAGIFPIKPIAKTLNEVISRKELDVRYQTNLVELRPDSREAVFEKMTTGEKETIAYDMIHVTPPMSAPAFIKDSPLSDTGGWLDVDMYTLQHKRYRNVFGLGDCTNTPNSKTAAAIRSQTPVVVSNLTMVIEGQEGKAAYDGYASCPLVTGYG